MNVGEFDMDMSTAGEFHKTLQNFLFSRPAILRIKYIKGRDFLFFFVKRKLGYKYSESGKDS